MSGLNTISDLVVRAHQAARMKGFHEDGKITDAHRLLLIIGEVNEAFEELRSGHEVSEVYVVDGKPEGVGVELADTVIRIFDFAGLHNIPLETLILDKMRFNESRPHKHGKRF